MTSESTNRALNRLLAIHHRSLPMYLSYASPEWHRGDERARETLQLIVQSQQEMVDRIGEMIIEGNGDVRYGAFPIVYTGYHDLSFDFLLDKLIEAQQQDIKAIEQCVKELGLVPIARSLAEECLGAAKAHLESLQELKQPAPAALNH